MPKERILVVDDSADARKGLAIFLKAKGFQINEAASGEEAFEMLKKNTYDLVLSDLKMQHIDGIQVLKHTKDNYPSTDVIIMTAFASVDTAVGAMKLGAFDYISKPLNMDELEITVDRCLEKQKLAAEVAGLKEVVSLYEVSKGLTSVMDLEELLQLIVKLAAETLNAENGSIMLLDVKTGELLAKAATGERKNSIIGTRLKVGERIAGYAAKSLKTVIVNGPVEEDSRFSNMESIHGVTSGLSAPLIWKNKLLGVINLSHSSPDKKFTDDDSNLLSIFAAQAAIAIENSSLFNDLQKEKEKAETVFREMASGAVITDDRFNILMTNKKSISMLGLTKDEYMGLNLIESIKDLKPSLSWDSIQRSGERIINFELSRKGEFPLFISVNTTKIRDEEDNLVNYVMILNNVTEEKKEDTIKKNFIRLMSHKLRTPLTSIIGFTSTLMIEDTLNKLNENEQKALEIIENKGDHLSSLVDKLLRFSMLESKQLIPAIKNVNLSEIANNSIELLDKLITRTKAKVIFEPGFEKLPEVSADKSQLREVFENLIDNAIKFNDKEEKEVTISGMPVEDKYVQVTVKDNGPGIPKEELETIFRRFYQLEKYFTGQIEGAGLGLSLARRIVVSHNGTIWVESEIGKGSKFIFTVPVAQET
jgi:PAS domain S-box-containing protein